MNKVTRVMLVSSIMNILLTILKISCGFIYKSSALIADGFHSLSDLLTDFVAIVGGKLSLIKADKKHPYGHGKIEYLTSILIGIVVIILGFELIINSFDKTIVIPNLLVLIISVITIISKFCVSQYIIKKGEKYSNSILIASGKESRMDVISSIVVLISIILMQYSNSISYFKYADLIACIIVALLIIKTGFVIIKDNACTLLEESVNEEYIEEIKQLILKNNKIDGIDKLDILKYGPYYKLIGELSMNPQITLVNAHQIIEEIENEIKEKDEKIKYITFHINPSILTGNSKGVKIKALRK